LLSHARQNWHTASFFVATSLLFNKWPTF
jgi:hypothetical protein